MLIAPNDKGSKLLGKETGGEGTLESTMCSAVENGLARGIANYHAKQMHDEATQASSEDAYSRDSNATTTPFLLPEYS